MIPMARFLLFRVIVGLVVMSAAGCFSVDLDDLAKDPPVKRRFLLAVESEPVAATKPGQS